MPSLIHQIPSDIVGSKREHQIDESPRPFARDYRPPVLAIASPRSQHIVVASRLCLDRGKPRPSISLERRGKSHNHQASRPGPGSYACVGSSAGAMPHAIEALMPA